jgi:hypothetical protein
MLQNHPSLHVGPSPHEYTINYGRIADVSGFARSQTNEISRRDPVTNFRSARIALFHYVWCEPTSTIAVRTALRWITQWRICMHRTCTTKWHFIALRPGTRLINLLIRGKAHFPSPRHSLRDTCSLDSQAASMASIHIQHQGIILVIQLFYVIFIRHHGMRANKLCSYLMSTPFSD